ncbi:hypothetical protein SAMN02799630_01365 [Paenibacillus sp. UNCCL117]|uniref:DUF6220 domain-containing protein n=1 Tax=unclassified Paenibacillus TaxID=185978 RepID=UPI0008846108|nr:MULTISPECIES: DUF6220 domain-containing protein [unclassified Paenibacillus]SDC74570.1 hypothetical protein SAMN04488602_103343 [Paenibacillus sp. cl123]SFW25257.1 hypothetical protein SAMN02799630_01365 [Paenibacillus sp. UNCCL117]
MKANKGNSSEAVIRFSRGVFQLLAWAFVLSVGLQTLLAGMAIFQDPGHWSKHTSFVHIIEFIPILMFLLAFPAKWPAGLKLQSAGLFLMIFAQYMTAHLSAAGPLHPVIALLLFWLSIITARQSSRLGRSDGAEVKAGGSGHRS